MPMKNLGVMLFLTALAAVTLVGCSEDNAKPAITRLHISEKCGVAPLHLELRADATGGVPQSDPTGGNNFLTMDWSFGDGSGIDNGSSIVYHTYEDPGVYVVTVSAEDADGDRASRSDTVYVFADSLQVGIISLVEDPETGDLVATSTVDACQDIRFLISAAACDFDSVTGYYERFLYRWEMQDDSNSVYLTPQVNHSFPPGNAGEHQIRLILEDPGRSITRNESYTLMVEYQGADLEAQARWEAPDPDTLVVPRGEFPSVYQYTVDLANRGPDPGYNVRVTGLFPEDEETDYRVDGWDASVGELSYAPDDSIWVWNIDYVPASTNQYLRLDLEIADAVPDTHTILNQVEYVCDDDPLDDAWTLALRVRAAELYGRGTWEMGETGLYQSSNFSTTWHLPSGEDPASYVIDDTLVVTWHVRNQGPEPRPTEGSEPVFIQGTIPDATRPNGDDILSFVGAYVTVNEFNDPNSPSRVIDVPLDPDQYTVDYDEATRMWTVGLDSLPVIQLKPNNVQGDNNHRYLEVRKVNVRMAIQVPLIEVLGEEFRVSSDIIVTDPLDALSVENTKFATITFQDSK